MGFKAPKCPVCNRVQKASSALQHKKGNYACACNSVDYSKATEYRKQHRFQEDDCSELKPGVEYKFTIPGNPVVKKNSQRVVMHGIRPSVLYEVWAARALKIIMKQWEGLTPIKGPVHMEAHYYKDTKRESDLSNLHEGIQDCLTVAGVWIDDTIVESHDGSRKHVDKKNPRIEVTLRKFKED